MFCSLKGHHILVVEDQPLIALDIMQSFEAAGAVVTMTYSLRHALILIEEEGLAGAILDHALGEDDSSSLCARLTERGIPFLIYSGFKSVPGECKDAVHLEKPATEVELVTTMAQLIFGGDYVH